SGLVTSPRDYDSCSGTATLPIDCRSRATNDRRLERSLDFICRKRVSALLPAGRIGRHRPHAPPRRRYKTVRSFTLICVPFCAFCGSFSHDVDLAVERISPVVVQLSNVAIKKQVRYLPKLPFGSVTLAAYCPPSSP